MEIISGKPEPREVIDMTFVYDEKDAWTTTIDEKAGDYMTMDGKNVVIQLAEHKDLMTDTMIPKQSIVVYLDKVRRTVRQPRMYTPPTVEQIEEFRKHFKNR